MSDILVEDMKGSIRAIPDFPKKGILFRDITPLLIDKGKFRKCIDHFVSFTKTPIDYVISIESRGFILGSALAYALGAGFVPIRKEGKLPHTKFQTSYELEYGSAVVEIHTDAIHEGSNVILMDDVLATGGTMRAAIELVSKFGAKIEGIYFLIEIKDLDGRKKLKGYPVHSLISY
ncbi:MAG: adenine phosphoribosyltransferase [Omnitrophica bacterium RIFCSPHIGHO2_02_FULL_51_18]|nr:MAG: adenine phosphoribosyltransferase [Omnitrophica bacterium RIFCSPHIGHO2_02_FULL_51_18]